MRSAAVLLACRAAGLAPSPARRHALALLGGAAPAARPQLRRRRPRRLMYVPNMCELNAHMLLRELRAKGIAAGAVVAPDTFLYRQRGGAGDGRKGWGFHVFVAAGADVRDFELFAVADAGTSVGRGRAGRAPGRGEFRVVGGDGRLARARTAGPDASADRVRSALPEGAGSDCSARARSPGGKRRDSARGWPTVLRRASAVLVCGVH